MHPQTAETWHFPDGVVAQGVDESFVIYNPNGTAAEVDLVIETDDTDGFGEIEPFQLTVPPEGYEEIVVQEEERIGSALDDAGENVLRHGASVFSLNGVGVVAERVLAGDDTSERRGLDVALGAPLLSDRAVVAASGPEGAATLVIQNSSGTDPAAVTVVALEDGERVAPGSAADLEVPVAGRLVVGIDELGLPFGEPLLVTADRPVAIERRLVVDQPVDITSSMAIPLAGSAVLPAPLGG